MKVVSRWRGVGFLSEWVVRRNGREVFTKMLRKEAMDLKEVMESFGLYENEQVTRNIS